MNGQVGTMHVVPISRIVVNDQSRQHFDDIEGLAKSIEQNGLINPLSVDPDCHLVAGERRYRALKLLGREEVPVIVVPPQKRRSIQLAENADRKNLTASELDAARRAREAELAEQVKAKTATLPPGKTVKAAVADELVRAGAAESVTDVERKGRIVREGAPELVAAVDAGTVSVGAASKLIHLPKEEQAEIAKKGKAAAAAAAREVKADRKPKAEKAEKEVLKDGLGNPVPDRVADAFGDPALRSLIADVFEYAKAGQSLVERIKGVARKSSAWPFANFGYAMTAVANGIDDVKQAHAHLENGVPFAVCPTCGGTGCPACGQSGYLTRHMHDNADQYGG